MNPDDIEHIEHPGNQRGIKVKGLKNVILHQGDGLNTSLDIANKDLMKALPELQGKTLGCWCKPKACHGDVLVRLIEEKYNQIKLKLAEILETNPKFALPVKEGSAV